MSLRARVRGRDRSNKHGAYRISMFLETPLGNLLWFVEADGVVFPMTFTIITDTSTIQRAWISSDASISIAIDLPLTDTYQLNLSTPIYT